MTSSQHLDQRTKDVLLALATASAHKDGLARLQLQKFIYLFDILAIAWRDVEGSNTFLPWNHGPYDRTIQNAVDCLAFRGLVSIAELSFRDVRKAQCLYSLTPAGKLAVERLVKEKPFANDIDLFREMSMEINRRGWSKIKDIVYSEPTYNTARVTQQGTTLFVSQNYNLAWKLVRGVRDGFELGRQKPMSRRTLVQVFFATLDQYRLMPEADLLKKVTQ
jgi:hypothetical protein